MKSLEIEKLEKLSCLSIPEIDKEPIKKSIEEVFEMLHKIDRVNIDNKNEKENKPTSLSKDEINNEYLFDKTKPSESVNIQDSFFLAPKVISKD